MLLVLVKKQLLCLPSNNNNFQTLFFLLFFFFFFFFFFFSFLPFCRNLCRNKRKREKRKWDCCYRRGGTSFTIRRFLRKGTLRISFASTKICPPKQKNPVKYNKRIYLQPNTIYTCNTQMSKSWVILSKRALEKLNKPQSKNKLSCSWVSRNHHTHNEEEYEKFQAQKKQTTFIF